MSSSITERLTQNGVARITGGCYLGFILASVLADRLGHIGLGEPEQIYQAVVAHATLFRLALVVAFVSAFLFLVTAWGLYVLLRPVNKSLALLFLLLNTVGVAIQCASMFPLLSALLMGDGGSHMQAYSAAQLEGLGYLSADVYKTGFATAQLFFGTWLFPLGYLVYKSRFLPRFLGVLLLIDGVAELVWFLQALLLPTHHMLAFPGFVISGIAEVGLTLWLLVKGVKVVDSAARLPVDDQAPRRRLPSRPKAGSIQVAYSAASAGLLRLDRRPPRAGVLKTAGPRQAGGEWWSPLATASSAAISPSLCSRISSRSASMYLLLATLPLYVVAIGGTVSDAGIVVACFTITAVIVRPWIGRLSDRRQEGPHAGARAVVLAGSSMLYEPAHSVPLVMAVRVFHGVGWAAASAPPRARYPPTLLHPPAGARQWGTSVSAQTSLWR